MKILIIGGYGNTGYNLAQLLLQETDVEIILAGRNLKKAEEKSIELNEKYEGSRASAIEVDASNYESCLAVFKLVDFVVAASSTIEYVKNVADAALECGIDYLDTQLSSIQKLNYLFSIEEKIKAEGRIFITDGGYHPGLPAAMIRLAALNFDKLTKANIYAYMQINWKELEFSSATREEFILELSEFNPLIFKDKKWQKMPMSKAPRYNFGSKFGENMCVPMLMKEIELLPSQISTLKETGFYISGFDWFTNYITMPIGMIILKIVPKLAKKFVGKLFEFGTNTFTKPPFGVKLVLEAEGIKNNELKKETISIEHNDGYYLTAVPVAVCIKQYLDGIIKEKGLYTQGNVVEPQAFIKEILRLCKK